MTSESSRIDQLEHQLGQGDQQALDKLFDLHRARLERIVFFRMNPMLRSRLEPGDILQEAYIAAVNRLDHYARNPFKSAFLWLRMIVNQTLVDLHRRHIGAQGRDVRREVAADGLIYPQSTSSSLIFQLADSATSPSQLVSRHELLEKVSEVVEGMDALDREILALRHFEELTNQEAAAALEISQKAASIRYVRALRRLKRVLADLSGFFAEADDEQ